MVFTRDNNKITIEFTTDELPILEWIDSTYGGTEFNRYITKWFENRKINMVVAQKEQINTKLASLSDSDKQLVLDHLEQLSSKGLK